MILDDHLCTSAHSGLSISVMQATARAITRITTQVATWPVWMCATLGLCASLALIGCEDTEIFADPEPERASSSEMSMQSAPLESVGVCASDEDCPQWTCVTSSCVEGLCTPRRASSVGLSVETLGDQGAYVSVAVMPNQVVALAGEISVELSELTLSTNASSLGVGESLTRWTREDSSSAWGTPETWSPTLERVMVRPALSEDEGPREERTPLTLRGVTLDEARVWIHAGDTLRDVWAGAWGSSSGQGRYYRLAAPLQSLTLDEGEAWASVFDKGLERLALGDESTSDDDADDSFEANARFNTPGRALMARAGRGFVVVADGYAGLSLFEKRVESGLASANPSRLLITPPQESPSEGRVAHLDLIEDRVISAELGIGVNVTQITPEGGLSPVASVDLGGVARWVTWVDPYTAIAWVDGRGLVLLDLLTADLSPRVAFTLDVAAELGQERFDVARWSALHGEIALLSATGDLAFAELKCDDSAL